MSGGWWELRGDCIVVTFLIYLPYNESPYRFSGALQLSLLCAWCSSKLWGTLKTWGYLLRHWGNFSHVLLVCHSSYKLWCSLHTYGSAPRCPYALRCPSKCKCVSDLRHLSRVLQTRVTLNAFQLQHWIRLANCSRAMNQILDWGLV